MSRIRFRFRPPWQATGRHYKLMLATTIVALLLIPILWLSYGPIAGVVILLWLLTLAVQWLCIEPPDVEEKDLH
ncbi:MAG: hypothetical protein RL685_938 [Pseudomonadota bacterium]|jgi:uncharacterized metal-binding protein